MSATKRLWEETVERICDAYAAHELTRYEALKELIGKGFDWIDAENCLDAYDEISAGVDQ